MYPIVVFMCTTSVPTVRVNLRYRNPRWRWACRSSIGVDMVGNYF